MKRLLVFLCLAALMVICQGALAQTKIVDLDGLKKEIDLLKRENELLKRENDLLKKEIESLKKGSAAKPPESATEAVLAVTVDDVEYVYQGCVRNGPNVFITLLATSKKGDQQAPGGDMTVIDDDGDKYRGVPTVGVPPLLREGVPVKVTWRFGLNPLTGKSSAPSPKITRFASVAVEPIFGRPASGVDFRNVPAVVSKPKAK